MNFKRVISISLLTFIFFSIVFLVHKELSRKDYDKANTSAEMRTYNPLPAQHSNTQKKQTGVIETISRSQG
jgi:hypothetical protein